MSWHYIVIRHKDKKWGEFSYLIHEGYGFNKKKIPGMWTKSSVAPRGENIKELRTDLAMMLKDAVSGPIYEERGEKLIKIKYNRVLKGKPS